jgi:molecular chaperone GrpE
MTKRPHGETQAHKACDSEWNETEDQSIATETDSTGSAETGVDQKSDKKGKKSDKTAHEERLNSEISEMKDRYVRLLAEYENFRKRSQKEREALYADAVAEVTKEWLPVIDNVERAICFSDPNSEDTAVKVAEGVQMIHRQITEVLAKFGVTEIDCTEGGCFDPNIHEAVMHVEDEGFGEQCVAQVFQKGYRTKDRVIRYSVVKVAN